MRLDKYLSDLGVGTRSELRAAVRRGRATVNGAVVKDPGMQLRGDERVCFDGNELSYERNVYYMMNKPAGVITAARDPHQRTVLDLMGEKRRKDLFPVGRLDKDTTGLLLLTNDGSFDHHLMSPKHHVDKRYEVTVRGAVTEEDVAAFAAGLRLDEEFTAAPAALVVAEPQADAPAEPQIDNACGEMPVTHAYVTIHEGKYHQVKRMFAAVGKEVLTLRRIAIGSLELDPELPEGSFRPLTEEEKRKLMERM